MEHLRRNHLVETLVYDSPVLIADKSAFVWG